MVTFLPTEEPDASHAGAALGEALVAIAKRRAKIAQLVTIDGGPALESPVAKVLEGHGFAGRRGALVFIPARGRAMARTSHDGRRGDRARVFADTGALVRFDDERAPLPSAPSGDGAADGDAIIVGDGDEIIEGDDDLDLDLDLDDDDDTTDDAHA